MTKIICIRSKFSNSPKLYVYRTCDCGEVNCQVILTFVFAVILLITCCPARLLFVSSLFCFTKYVNTCVYRVCPLTPILLHIQYIECLYKQTIPIQF